jgi:serine/threonine protein kinase
MAPEYSMGKAITVKADVYSFGIVLLEIVSGKVSADYTPNQEAEFLLDKVSGSCRINLFTINIKRLVNSTTNSQKKFTIEKDFII